MVLKNSLCHIWVCIPVRAIETCGVSLKWIRMKTTLGQMSSYSFQVRAKVHRTISPSVFTHLGRLCQESPEASDLNYHSFFHPKRQSCYHPSSGWKMHTTSSAFLLNSLFWALLHFPEWLPWETYKNISWSRPLCWPGGKYCMKMFSYKCTFLSL